MKNKEVFRVITDRVSQDRLKKLEQDGKVDYNGLYDLVSQLETTYWDFRINRFSPENKSINMKKLETDQRAVVRMLDDVKKTIVGRILAIFRLITFA